MSNHRQKPTLAEEKALRADGFSLIAGVDEVGRGALMGPVETNILDVKAVGLFFFFTP